MPKNIRQRIFKIPELGIFFGQQTIFYKRFSQTSL
jgi:hypothetical protein